MSPTKSISASTTPSTTALAERSPNTCSPTKTQTLTTKKMDAGSVPRFEHAGQKYTAGHGGQSQGQNQSQTYISPSDAIASPTTKKLSQIKGRRFMYVARKSTSVPDQC